MIDRKRLPLTRQSLTRKNAVGSLEFYVTISFYQDEPCRPGEIFIHVAKEGSTLGGICTSLALICSLALQHGVPWSELSRHFRNARFDPSGLSIDHSEEYPSLVHAVAHTVDLILSERVRSVHGGQLNSPLSEAALRSDAGLQPDPSDPSPASDGSR